MFTELINNMSTRQTYVSQFSFGSWTNVMYFFSYISSFVVVMQFVHSSFKMKIHQLMSAQNYVHCTVSFLSKCKKCILLRIELLKLAQQKILGKVYSHNWWAESNVSKCKKLHVAIMFFYWKKICKIQTSDWYGVTNVGIKIR